MTRKHKRSSTVHVCAQRGCRFELEDVERDDAGETKVERAPDPELCPVCGNPFLEHPAPETL